MKNDKLLKLGIVVIAIIFIIIAYKIFRVVSSKNEKIDLSGNEFYQYFSGIKCEYSGKMEIIHKENGQKILILEDGSTVDLDATPMYYQNQLKRVLLPSKLEIIYPSQKKQYKLGDFTVLYKENKEIKVKTYKENDAKSKKIADAFLYDGQDMYMFLEETTIKVGEDEYTVSPFSYAYVSYRDYIEIYDYEKDEDIVIQNIEQEKDIIAYTESYTINMSIDYIEYEGVQQLLIKKLDYIPDFEY